MSPENVELAKRFNEAQRRADFEAAVAFLAEDVVATDFGTRLDTPKVVCGREELIQLYFQMAELFDGYLREVEEWVDAGEWVIAVGRWVGAGTASGVPIEVRGANPVRCGAGRSSSISLTSRARRLPSKG